MRKAIDKINEHIGLINSITLLIIVAILFLQNR